MTIVTDTLKVDPLATIYGVDVFPAHSWIIFGATAEERPLRVELVCPMINDVPHGFAVSVIELFGEGEDVGDIDYIRADKGLPPDRMRPDRTDTSRKPKTVRTNSRLAVTTRLRNSEIFNPSLEPNYDTLLTEDLPRPLLGLTIATRAMLDDQLLSLRGSYLGNSHRFVEALLARREFSPRIPDELRMTWVERPSLVGSNARARYDGNQWATLKRYSKIVTNRPLAYYRQRADPNSEVSMQLERDMQITSPTNHIFYEARVPQPSLRGALRRTSFAALLELYPVRRHGRTVYRPRSIQTPWTDLFRVQPPPQSPFRHGQSMVSLSRDPRLTSGYLMPAEFGSLPVLPPPPPASVSSLPITSADPPSTAPSPSTDPAAAPAHRVGTNPSTPSTKPSWWQRLFCVPGPSAALSRRSPQAGGVASWCSTS